MMVVNMIAISVVDPDRKERICIKLTKIVHQELDPGPDPFFPDADPFFLMRVCGSGSEFASKLCESKTMIVMMIVTMIVNLIVMLTCGCHN